MYYLNKMYASINKEQLREYSCSSELCLKALSLYSTPVFPSRVTLRCKCMNGCYSTVRGRNVINMRNTFSIQNISRIQQLLLLLY